MGRKGWGGSPPTDDAEARKRIVDATLRTIERRGPEQTTLSDVADDLGITRRTVYRYFSSTEELFVAAAEWHSADSSHRSRRSPPIWT